MKKERVDVLLVERGFFETREKAKAAVMAGLVLVGGERCDKPGTKIPEDTPITVKGEVHPYVSRGGLKLEKALRVFGIDLNGRVMMDIGASTGGFTDCALQHGARRVYAIDVGYGQLAWSLRQDERVVVMERTNFRHMDPDAFDDERPDAASIDVSFISLKLILPRMAEVLLPGGQAVTLIKPQFEAGRAQAPRGVVRDPAVREAVCQAIRRFGVEELSLEWKGLAPSPLAGPRGNVEFLAWWGKPA